MFRTRPSTDDSPLLTSRKRRISVDENESDDSSKRLCTGYPNTSHTNGVLVCPESIPSSVEARPGNYEAGHSGLPDPQETMNAMPSPFVPGSNYLYDNSGFEWGPIFSENPQLNEEFCVSKLANGTFITERVAANGNSIASGHGAPAYGPGFSFENTSIDYASHALSALAGADLGESSKSSAWTAVNTQPLSIGDNSSWHEMNSSHVVSTSDESMHTQTWTFSDVSVVEQSQELGQRAEICSPNSFLETNPGESGHRTPLALQTASTTLCKDEIHSGNFAIARRKPRN